MDMRGSIGKQSGESVADVYKTVALLAGVNENDRRRNDVVS